MRDTAFRGLGALLRRDEWSRSESYSTITERIRAALSDSSAVVRMHAASAVQIIYADFNPGDRAAAIGDLLITEENAMVRTVLLRQLTVDIGGAPYVIDSVLSDLLDLHTDTLLGENSELDRGIMSVLGHLAMVLRTPFAAQVVQRWCEEAPRHPARVCALAQWARHAMSPGSDTGRDEAYRLMCVAAEASLERWKRDPREHLKNVSLSRTQLDELRGAVDVAHEIAQQLYFASGAHNEKNGQARSVGPGELQKFADLALPVLAACAELQVPRCVHQSVQTMIFLAPWGEARALQAVAQAVPATGLYASDVLAAGEVMPYLKRLLVDERTLVLFDPDGVAAFRHLLATFAAAGNEDALTLAYTFGDVFR